MIAPSIYIRPRRFPAALAAVLLCCAAGCGDQSNKVATAPNRTPEQARKELAELNKDYSPGEFVRSALNGDLLALRLFLDAGMNVNAANTKGMTALMAACLDGHTNIVTLLLDREADVNAQSTDGDTALMVASSKGHTDIVKLLLDKGADPKAVKSEKRMNPLMIAAVVGQAGVVKALVGKGAPINDKNADGMTALILACALGQIDAVKVLLPAGSDLEVKDSKGMTALDYARETGQAELVRLLSQAGAKAMTDYAFSEIRRDKGMEMLLTARDEIGRFVSEGGKSTSTLAKSRVAFSKGTVERYRTLGMSSAQIFWMLLAAQDGIEMATYSGTMFSEHLDPKVEDGLNGLKNDCAAALSNAFQDFVTDPASDLNWRDENGMTALMHVAKRGHVEMAKTLVEKGAETDLKSKDGKRAADYAMEGQQYEVARLLGVKGLPEQQNGAGRGKQKPLSAEEQRALLDKYDRNLAEKVWKRMDEMLNAVGYTFTNLTVIAFKLHADGRVTDIAVQTNDGGNTVAFYCMKAVLDSAPFPLWPTEIRRMMKGDQRGLALKFDFVKGAATLQGATRGDSKSDAGQR